MSDLGFNAQVEAARAYEALFVPALFGPWAAKVADAARLEAGESVLDLAAGTGVLAREVRRRVAPTGYVVGLDPNAGMLAVAEELEPGVDWRQGTAEAMPFADESFDVVVSQFGLMFMDRERALREILRVLKPGGRAVLAVWDRLESIPAYAAEVEVLERIAGPRAGDALRAPFALGDGRQLVRDLRAAGAGPVTLATPTGIARFPGIRVMVEADLRGWLPVMGVTLTEPEIERILREAEDVLRIYVGDEGQVSFAVRAHLVTAAKPRRAEGAV